MITTGKKKKKKRSITQVKVLKDRYWPHSITVNVLNRSLIKRAPITMKYLVHCIGLIMLSVCTISGCKPKF